MRDRGHFSTQFSLTCGSAPRSPASSSHRPPDHPHGLYPGIGHTLHPMSASAKLVGIKLLHTVIWVVLSAVIYYLLYAVITDRIDRWFWWGLGLVGLEIATLVLFRMSCPLTVVARRYSASQRANFDIYLPEWIARHNKTIYSMIMGVVLVGLVWRLVG